MKRLGVSLATRMKLICMSEGSMVFDTSAHGIIKLSTSLAKVKNNASRSYEHPVIYQREARSLYNICSVSCDWLRAFVV